MRLGRAVLCHVGVLFLLVSSKSSSEKLPIHIFRNTLVPISLASGKMFFPKSDNVNSCFGTRQICRDLVSKKHEKTDPIHQMSHKRNPGASHHLVPLGAGTPPSLEDPPALKSLGGCEDVAEGSACDLDESLGRK